MNHNNSENNEKNIKLNNEGKLKTFFNKDITTKRMNNRILLDKVGKNCFLYLSYLF